jgi:hypothetical protein
VPPEQHLQHAVDDILEAVWPRERHRAMVRLATSILGRTAVFVSALLVLSFAVYLVFGLVMPWTFFVFMTALTLVCAAGDEQRAHLGRDTERSPGNRSSTGCYPRNGCDCPTGTYPGGGYPESTG